jgi:hypothetical protein
MFIFWHFLIFFFINVLGFSFQFMNVSRNPLVGQNYTHLIQRTKKRRTLSLKKMLGDALPVMRSNWNIANYNRNANTV